MTTPPEKSRQTFATNRKALHEYFVLERFEAGVELRGTEVKSVRNAQISLSGSFARMGAGGIFLENLNIPAYEFGNRFNHEPDRPRRLLLHKKEIEKLQAQIEQKGNALVPLRIYLRRGRVKVELGLCRGKAQADKRETLRRRTADREAAREIARQR